MDGVDFMEDDEDERSEYLNDTSRSYDLSTPLTRARRHSLTLQQTPSSHPSSSSSSSAPSTNPASSSLPSSSSSSSPSKAHIPGRKPPASSSGLQTIPSGVAVNNFIDSKYSPSSPSSISPQDPSSSVESAEVPQEDILQPLIGMTKRKRKKRIKN